MHIGSKKIFAHKKLKIKKNTYSNLLQLILLLVIQNISI